MEISSKGVEAIRAVEKTYNRIRTIRVVRTRDHGTYCYCSDWMITDIKKPAEDEASISLLGVFPEPLASLSLSFSFFEVKSRVGIFGTDPFGRHPDLHPKWVKVSP